MANRKPSRQRVTPVHKAPLLCSMLFLSLFFLQALILPACNKRPQGNAADGERWYRLNRCNGCHGEGGTGGKGPELAATDLSFRQFVHKIRASDSTVMPSFEPEQLPDKDAADIYLWLVALKK